MGQICLWACLADQLTDDLSCQNVLQVQESVRIFSQSPFRLSYEHSAILISALDLVSLAVTRLDKVGFFWQKSKFQQIYVEILILSQNRFYNYFKNLKIYN